jgi:hypothetical protein
MNSEERWKRKYLFHFDSRTQKGATDTAIIENAKERFLKT